MNLRGLDLNLLVPRPAAIWRHRPAGGAGASAVRLTGTRFDQRSLQRRNLVKYVQAVLVAGLMMFAVSGDARAADITGSWRATFDTQIGTQDYMSVIVEIELTFTLR
jgi:hypothetical protein